MGDALIRRGITRCFFVVVSSALTMACRHQGAPISVAEPAVAARSREFCWWAVLRSVRTPDSISARFRHAYSEMGFVSVTSGTVGDTTWAHAGPDTLASRARHVSYESGAIAYPRGAIAHFRYFVAIAPPSGGWTAKEDSVTAAAGDIDFCAEVAHRSAIMWSAPPRPTGEESLPLWNADPWGASRVSVHQH